MVRRCAAVLGLLMSGCASSSPVKIPCGEWTGCGTFAYERWAPPEKAASIHRDYPTRLKIHQCEFENQPATEIEIVSEHGGIPGLSDEKTHLRLALVEERRPRESIGLYRVVPLDPDRKNPPEVDDDAPPIAASCMKSRNGIVLHINYAEGFVDSFWFRGRGLTKAGSLAQDTGIIHWTETLHQVAPADLMSSGISFR
jgi:hypothetical protein